MKITIGKIFTNLHNEPLLVIDIPGVGILPVKKNDKESFSYIDLTTKQLKKLRSMINKELSNGRSSESDME